MTLEGKLSSEIGVHATAAKWFSLFATQLHDVQNLTDRVHGTKLHHGEDWHHGETIKHWTYTIGEPNLKQIQESLRTNIIQKKQEQEGELRPILHGLYGIHDGKVHTCLEKIESVDEHNKTVRCKLFGENIDKEYKVFKLILQAIDKSSGGAIIKCTIEYERIGDDVDPPYGWIEYLHTCTRDIDGHLIKA